DQMNIPIDKGYTPFNRPHPKDAAFCLYFTMDLNNSDYSKISLHASLIEAGQVGQLLMDRQADFNIGLVPVGGVNFEDFKKRSGISDSKFLVHSFIGGYYSESPRKSISLQEFKKTPTHTSNPVHT